ncbi:hypothetical protein [Bacillus rhizoplanae]|uniref:hypothetical protein n=1 Tax=Bacillus rhizoplanae TaxID=2880966 RepID=UPI003D1CD1E5
MYNRTYNKDGKKLTGAAAEEAIIKDFVESDPMCKLVSERVKLNKEFEDKYIHNNYDIKNMADILKIYNKVVQEESSNGILQLEDFKHYDQEFIKDVLDIMGCTYDDGTFNNSPVLEVW